MKPNDIGVLKVPQHRDLLQQTCDIYKGKACLGEDLEGVSFLVAARAVVALCVCVCVLMRWRRRRAFD
jgi:hypothetical protein